MVLSSSAPKTTRMIGFMDTALKDSSASITFETEKEAKNASRMCFSVKKKYDRFSKLRILRKDNILTVATTYQRPRMDDVARKASRSCNQKIYRIRNLDELKLARGLGVSMAEARRIVKELDRKYES